jgi:hypothetical protein
MSGELGCVGVGWIHQAEDGAHRRAVVNTEKLHNVANTALGMR